MSRDRVLSPGTVRWWWIRHAPVPATPGLILGQMDLPCDTSDLDMMILLAERLPVAPTVLLSPLLRARQTLQALENAGAVFHNAHEEPALLEQNFGTWEGRTWNDLTAGDHPDDTEGAFFWKDPATGIPPGGESFETLVRRVDTGIRHWTDIVGTGDIVAVAHAGSIRAAMAVALDLDPAVALRLEVAPLSLTCLQHHAGAGWSVQSMNEVPP
ncbi:histidine phosphatase family protein [Phaeovibrio sulfidiphilus]|uniref:Histidine phosphatase family protein n=2 Tax=Phaeovibrio sulfidiphilus TaxID=1220600 RepID=A0A8J6YND6_9PROT|nr:histidine phosphatase family protein [Phaeovibrio sulfidiphilus]